MRRRASLYLTARTSRPQRHRILPIWTLLTCPKTWRLEWIFRLFPAVEKFWNHPAGKLSGGQKQMLAVARAIVEPRKLLIVDEPSKGLAPAIINNMIDAFAQLKETGTTILLVEQNISFAKRLGDYVAVMDNGKVVHAGSMQELADSEDLQHALLGLAI